MSEHLHECGYCERTWRTLPNLVEASQDVKRFMYKSRGDAEARNHGYTCRGCGAATHDWRKGSPYHADECPVGKFETAVILG